MSDQTINELPSEIREQLPEHAQQIFAAALSAAQSNGLSEEGAREIAWNSVKNEYESGNDGKWQRKPEDTAIHNKSVVSGGN
jgi:cation transport regulator